MQKLLGYKFKYEFVNGALNILPDLLSCNLAMYLVRGNKDPQVTVILESLILLVSGPSLPQTPATAPVVTPQLLVIGPAPSSEAAPPLVLPGTLLTTSWWPSTPHQTARLSGLSCPLTPFILLTI
ncbi:hypothetical protein DSO57_1028618 [Entomophthora muscae]|uniref:Uncharacterized protein n=1 Tax=Entomophthora muscae TaxID=34485 RepID=A0ACC2U077_9FUNG|nr:hypothetical protein DSO57_1028618 [Entomophthora muscae]